MSAPEDCSAIPQTDLVSTAFSGARFSRYVVWTFAARLLMVVNSVVAGIIVARWLGTEGVGQLAVINVSVATLVQLGSLGLPSANTYFIAQEQNRFKAAASNSLLTALLIGALLAAGLTLISRVRPDWFSFISPDLIRIAALSIPFQLLTLIGLNILLAVGKIREFNLLDLVGQSFVLINAIIVLIVVRSGLDRLVLLNTVAAVIISVVVALFLIQSGKNLFAATRWRTDFGLLMRMLLYGMKFHFSILAGALIFRADLLVVNHYSGAAEAGVYSVATQVGLLIMLLPAVIGTLLFPRVSAEQDKFGETTCRVMRYTTLVMLSCCLAAVPLSFLIPIVYGPGFRDATIQFLILLPGVYLVGLESVAVQHFNSLGLPKAVPLFWLVTLVVNVFLVFVLTPAFGARGAAVASTISYTLIFVLVTAYFIQTTGKSISSLFLLRGSEIRELLTQRSRLTTSSGSVDG